ncbi:MAG: Gfo/Idh/MocA family oxidoreductase [Pseudomonadota bacterium]
MHKVIVIGTGGIGKRHLRGLVETGRVKLTLVEPDDGRRKEAEALFEHDGSHATLKEAGLASHDLAIICTPAHLHIALMSDCAAAGVPFLVEKPLAVSMDGVDEAIESVRRAGILARIGYIRRIAPEVQALRQQIDTGKIGEIKLAYVNSSQEFPKYRPDYRTTYYSRPEMGGGAILDAASHSFDMLIWLMGQPVTVGAMYDHLVLEGSQTEDTCLVTIRFESGAMAHAAINQFQKRNVASIEFIGTRGNLELDHSTLNFADDDSGDWSESRDFMNGLVPTEAHQARFTMQANAMLDAIEGKPDILATLDDARTNLMVALAAKRSWQERRFIDLAE